MKNPTPTNLPRFLLLIILLTFGVPTLQAQTCEICHYWSFEGCTDTCYRADPNLGAEWAACYQCCVESCGSGGGGTGDEDDNDCIDCSPVVIDLGTGTFAFTSAADGVAFDIDADGTLDRIGWTAPASGDGFLVLDRNWNGTIDDGTELFGNYTPQPPSPAPNGFRALAVYDANGDRVITQLDPVWSSLRIWIDADHDGRSSAAELTELPAHGIRSIGLTYRRSGRRDGAGNELRYRSHVDRAGAPTFAVDVFLTDDRD